MDAEDPSTLCPDYDHVTWIWKTEKISSIASKLKNFDSILNKVLTMEKFSWMILEKKNFFLTEWNTNNKF